MHHSFRVKRVERGQHVVDYLPRLARRQRTYNRMEEIHRVEGVFADVLQNMDAYDSRMRELRETSGLCYEAPPQSGRFLFRDGFARRENLHREVGVQRLVLDAPYLACRTASEERDDAKAAERFAGMQKIALRGRGLAQGVVRGEIAVDVSFHPASFP